MGIIRNNDRKPNIALQSVDTETGQCTYRNQMTDEVNIMNLNKEQAEQLAEWLDGRNQDMIQDACPLLSVSEREMCLSGLDDDQWDEIEDEREPGDEVNYADDADAGENSPN